MIKAKKYLMALKESTSIPQDLRTWDIIYLSNKAWVSSFDRFDKNKNAIAGRQWSPLNCVLLAVPGYRATMEDQERENEEASEDVALPEEVVHGFIDLSTDSPTCNPKISN